MAFLKKDPETERQREEERLRKQQAAEEDRRRKEAEAAEAAFRATAQGRARTAAEAGQRFFQISLPISETERSWNSLISGVVETKTRVRSDQPNVLEQIEAEGWHLEHIGYVFQETGAVSRDKFLSSGQVQQVTGQVIGIYLFRSVA